MNYWVRLKQLLLTNEIVIDRPKGSKYPKFDSFILPLDYGYLKNTLSNNGADIDVWKGSLDSNELTGIVCTVDSMKKDSEVKLLINCNTDDIEILKDFYDNNEYMSGMIVNNPEFQ